MGFCLLAYVVLVHLSIVLDRPAMAGAALFLLGASFLWRPLQAGRFAAWIGVLAIAAISAWTVRQGVTLYALYLPPILLPLAMLYWWAGTLREGQVPFVTRIATLVRGPLPPDYAAYTRAVTQLWVGVFGALALAALGLALWAPAAIWSLFTNFLNTAFIGLVFLAEYLYRRRRFAHLQHPDFVSFIRLIVKANVRGPAPGQGPVPPVQKL